MKRAASLSWQHRPPSITLTTTHGHGAPNSLHLAGAVLEIVVATPDRSGDNYLDNLYVRVVVQLQLASPPKFAIFRTATSRYAMKYMMQETLMIRNLPKKDRNFLAQITAKARCSVRIPVPLIVRSKEVD